MVGVGTGITRAAVAVFIIALMSASGCASANAPRKTLQAFASDQELAELFKRWAEEHRRKHEARERGDSGRMASESASVTASPAPAAARLAESAPSGLAVDSITNVQHAGVDEGGIVKLHGDHLVILRRGRLFTVNVRGDQLRPVSAVNAFGTGIEPRGAWYDEMLISGNTVVVIGYSYARGGSEIGLFEIDRSGALAYRATYHLRSNDYYSSRNYASRLIGRKLVFYTPLRLNPWGVRPFEAFPAMRRWQPGVTASDFKRIAPATRIYRTDEELDPYQGVVLHTVTTCELERPELDCMSTGVLGPPGRVFYVSGKSVFVWTSASRAVSPPQVQGSAVFRIPLDGSAPSALKTVGSPVDQFSFLESEDGFLNVLVRSSGRGDGMWGAERNVGQLAMLRVPLSSFSDGAQSAPRSAYRALPTPSGAALQNRYIGPYLVYGAGTGWHRPRPTPHSQAYALRYAGDAAAHEVSLVHGVDRIEALGRNAVVIGTDGKNLHFTSLRLHARAEIVDRYTRANAAQGETRSHGFYFQPQGDEEGLVGLPIIGSGEAARQQLHRESASLLFLRNRSLKLTELGTLDSRADANAANDDCVASCVDWYGNSRPLFLKNRIFALLGYEIVEGALSGSEIVETRRVSFAPHWLDLWR